jgi:hypothetical protein
MKVVLSLLVAVAAITLVGSASAGQSFVDPRGEVPGSADIGSVTVTNDLSAGTITFQVGTNWPDWDSNTFFAILVDSDQNPATGTGGFDYVLTGNRQGGTVVNTAQPLVVPAQSSLENGVWTLTARTADIGNPQAISFFVLTQVGPDQRNPYEDRAPDTGTWDYSLVPPPPPTVKTAAARWTGNPVHGKAFRISGVTVSLSDGTVAQGSGTVCAATLAGKRLPGSGPGGCTFRLPKTSKGRRLVVKVTSSYGDTQLLGTYAFRVR